MKKVVKIDFEFDEKNNLVVQTDNKKKIIIDKITKTINTKDIYDMLNYDIETEYFFVPAEKKINVLGVENDHNRLYNYAYDLFDSLVKAINEKTKKINDDNDDVKEKSIPKELLEEELLEQNDLQYS